LLYGFILSIFRDSILKIHRYCFQKNSFQIFSIRNFYQDDISIWERIFCLTNSAINLFAGDGEISSVLDVLPSHVVRSFTWAHLPRSESVEENAKTAHRSVSPRGWCYAERSTIQSFFQQFLASWEILEILIEIFEHSFYCLEISGNLFRFSGICLGSCSTPRSFTIIWDS